MLSRLTTARHTITAATNPCRGISTVHHRPIASPLINAAGAAIVAWVSSAGYTLFYNSISLISFAPQTVYVVSNPMSNAQEHTSQVSDDFGSEMNFKSDAMHIHDSTKLRSHLLGLATNLDSVSLYALGAFLFSSGDRRKKNHTY